MKLDTRFAHLRSTQDLDTVQYLMEVRNKSLLFPELYFDQRSPGTLNCVLSNQRHERISIILFVNTTVKAIPLSFLGYVQLIYASKVFLLRMRNIKVLNFGVFFVFSPFLVILLLKLYLIKLIGLLGAIDLWSLLDNFIELFNGPWGL